MINKLLSTYILVDLLFLVAGGLLLVVALLSQSKIGDEETVQNIAQLLLISQSPLIVTIANAGLIILTFILSIPAIVFTDNRIWPNIHGAFVLLSTLFTLGVGISIWYQTLSTRSILHVSWLEREPRVQSLLQQKFDCCGYWNSTSPPYQVDAVCPSDLIAAHKEGCVGSFTNFANSYLDVLFTADFGVVALGVLLLLCIAMVLKDRKDKARYRVIDAKIGAGSI